MRSCESPLMMRALYSQSGCSFQACYQALIFCYVIGDLFSMLEAELHDKIEFVLSGRYEHCASPCAMSRERPVEVHDPAVRRFTSWGKRPILARFEPWCLRPFCHKIYKCGSLIDSGHAEFQLKRLQLDVPFSDPSS